MRAPSESAGRRLAAERISSTSLERLKRAGISFEEQDERHVLVDGRFTLNPTTLYWRNSDQSQQGYTIASLIAAVQVADHPGFTVKVPVRLTADQHHRLLRHCEKIASKPSRFLREAAMDKLDLMEIENAPSIVPEAAP